MAHKFEIIGQALVVTETSTNEIILDAPKKDLYYFSDYLKRDIIHIYDTSQVNRYNTNLMQIELSLAVDVNLLPFTKQTFEDFARLNLGFHEASFIETDPIYGASEASLFVSGDKAKYDSFSQTLDDNALANSDNVGRFRYYTDGTFSYLECCMESNGTYEWILISQQILV